MKKNLWKIFCASVLTLLVLSARAQVGDETAPERWLFIFDTSSAMKKCLPAEDKALKSMLVNSIGQSLHIGDSIAAWTFDEKLHMGNFPLVDWEPSLAAETESNLFNYARKPHYTGNTKFATLAASLNAVVKNSERLTVLIFCDGMDQITGTPYNDGINQIFLNSRAERKKSKAPFIIVLRTQNGEFVGGAVSFPPKALNIPPFPQLPEPEPEPVNVLPSPMIAPKPVFTAPPLIIVGTNVGTNAANLPPMSSSPGSPQTNIPNANNTQTASNNFLAGARTQIPSNPSARATATEKNSVRAVLVEEPTTPEPTDQRAKILLFIGGGLFAAAVALVIILGLVTRRRPRGSLITSSMQNDLRLRK